MSERFDSFKSFRDSKPHFKQALEFFDGSSEKQYKCVRDDIDKLLLIGDRLCCAGHAHREVSKGIKNLRKQLGEPEPHVGECLELWLKAVFWIIDPEAYNKRQGDKGFNLYAVILDLDLLSKQEIELSVEEADDIEDPVRKFILLAKEDRNPAIHDPAEVPFEVKGRMQVSPWVVLLASLARHRDSLMKALLRMVTRPLDPSDSVQSLLDQVHSERSDHLERFKGRDDWLDRFGRRLQDDSEHAEPITLLHAHEGSGKSALSAKLTECLQHQGEALGPAADEVRGVAPWLPGALLHMGKVSSDPLKIVRSLVAQANSMLLDPVALPELPDDDTSSLLGRGGEFQAPVPLRAEWPNAGDESFNTGANLQTASGRFGAQRSLIAQLRPSRQQVAWPEADVESFDTVANIQAAPEFLPAQKSLDEQLCQSLHQALVRLVRERGFACLILDATDEMDPAGKGLPFLPKPIPTGVRILVTGRPGRGIDKLQKNYHKAADRIKLNELNRDEIPLVTDVPDAGDEEKAFNDSVYTATQGLAFLAWAVGQEVRRNEGDFTQVQPSSQNAILFHDQSLKWREELLRWILEALTLFEPCAPLPLGALQRFAKFDAQAPRNKIKLPEVREALNDVEDQLQGLDLKSGVKLSSKGFAEYCRDDVLGAEDMLDIMERVVDWLARDERVESDPLIIAVLRYWGDDDFNHPDDLRESVFQLPAALAKGERAKLLFDIYHELRVHDGTLACALHCLELASEQGHSDAMGDLGWRLLHGDDVPADVARGQELLEKAVDAGDTRAMSILGMHLFGGPGVPADRARGQELLEKAVDAGDTLAMGFLGMRLLYGHGVPADAARGQELLEKTVEAGIPLAMLSLGQYLLYSAGVPADAARGQELLEKAVEAGIPLAMLSLSHHLLGRTDVPADAARGQELLEKAADTGDVLAACVLGARLLEGAGVPVDARRGQKLLEKAVDAGDTGAMRELGSRLLEGAGVPLDAQRGQKLLEKAVDAGDTGVMRALGERLLEGRGGPADAARGQKLLEKAVDAGDTMAMGCLGDRLLDGVGVPADLARGQELLEKAVDAGDTWAMVALGHRLLYGDDVPADAARGQELLEKAIDAGDTGAMVFLGMHLLYSAGVPADAARGQKLLEDAADAGNPLAMLFLGQHLLGGAGVPEDAQRGLVLLEKAADAGITLAMRDLGSRLLDGRGVPADAARGQALLEKAVDGGDLDAMRDLGRRLLEGNGVPADVQRGQELLERSREIGLGGFGDGGAGNNKTLGQKAKKAKRKKNKKRH